MSPIAANYPDLVMGIFWACVAMSLFGIYRSLHWDVFFQWSMVNLTAVCIKYTHVLIKPNMHVCVFSSMTYLLLTTARPILLATLLGDRFTSLMAPRNYSTIGPSVTSLLCMYAWVIGLTYGLVSLPGLYSCYATPEPADYCFNYILCFKTPTRAQVVYGQVRHAVWTMIQCSLQRHCQLHIVRYMSVDSRDFALYFILLFLCYVVLCCYEQILFSNFFVKIKRVFFLKCKFPKIFF